MGKHLYKLLVIAGLFTSGAGHADDGAWQESYRLEALYQYEAALAALNSVGSDNELALLRRGWLAYLQGAHSKSIDYYNKALSKNAKSLDARLGVMLPLMAQQRWREAALNANKALEVAPWNYHAHLRLMITEQALKQWSELAEHASAVTERYPSETDPWIFLARASRKLGNEKIAAQAYRKALELVPDNFEARQYID